MTTAVRVRGRAIFATAMRTGNAQVRRRGFESEVVAREQQQHHAEAIGVDTGRKSCSPKGKDPGGNRGQPYPLQPAGTLIPDHPRVWQKTEEGPPEVDRDSPGLALEVPIEHQVVIAGRDEDEVGDKTSRHEEHCAQRARGLTVSNGLDGQHRGAQHQWQCERARGGRERSDDARPEPPLAQHQEQTAGREAEPDAFAVEQAPRDAHAGKSAKSTAAFQPAAWLTSAVPSRKTSSVATAPPRIDTTGRPRRPRGRRN